jgi:hypothetical protein
MLPVSSVQKSRDWYVNKLGSRSSANATKPWGAKDQSGLTIFLVKATDPLAAQKITLTIQVANVDSTHQELAMVGVNVVSAMENAMREL